MEDKKFLYSVRPRRPIKNLNKEVAVIRTPKTLYLTADEVRECLKCGTVYRRFKADQNVQVAGRDVDRLHREEFLTEKEYAKLIADQQGKSRGTTEEVIPTLDSKGEQSDEKKEQKSSTSEKSNESPKRNSEDKKEAPRSTTVKSGTVEDQVEADKDEIKESDANDQASDSESTKVDNISVSEDKSEKKDDAKSAQVQVDQDADKKQNFQTSPIQVNTGYKNNKKGNNKH